MASTYSNTGIELIADGEQSGTWGQTTNLNWQIAEQLATGVVSIALTATTYTLATTDGALSDGRNAVVKFTGTPGGACTVTVSPNDMEKVYWIFNNSDETVTMSQGSGATIDVAAGSKKAVYCDGAGAGAAVVDLTEDLTITFNDNEKLTFGDGNDLEIVHDGTDSYIEEVGTGNFVLKSGVKVKVDAPDLELTGRAIAAVTTDNDLSFSMEDGNYFSCTPTGTGTLTFTEITAGQGGCIYLDNSADATISAAATTFISSADLTKINVAGKYFVSFFCADGTNVLVTASAAVTSAGA
jgi:hypothetical protein